VTDATGTPEWPRDDPVEIAFAAKVVMLAAASRTCAVDPPSQDQRDLLDEVSRVTARRHVQGRSFREFLDDAKGRLRRRASEEHFDDGSAAATLDDIGVAEPVDLIGALYGDLVRLASDVLAPALGEPIDPPLIRQVLEHGPANRPFPFEGRVPASRGRVMLSLYLARFDLRSLALLPYVLVHELVCHVGARATLAGDYPPDTDIRMFFADGFMDRVAWSLLVLWMDSGALVHDVPVGHLAESDIEYASRRPAAFRAGRAAWSNCTGALSGRLREERENRDSLSLSDLAAVRADAQGRAIEAALRLNACACGVAEKDAFVDMARSNDASATGTFADVARQGATPRELFERVGAQRLGSA